MSHRPTQKEKTVRAFRAYLDLLDTADWMRIEMRGQLVSFDLTIPGFRVLEMLYRDGPMFVLVVAERLRCKRQNVDVIIDRLEERGWVRRQSTAVAAVAVKPSHFAKAKRKLPRQGRRMSVVRLTPLGEKFIGMVFPKHAKVVKALMRALDGREQVALSRMCRKLREGDFLKFTAELTHVYVGE